MPKLVIGKAPATFELAVSIPTPTGEQDVVFIARHFATSAWNKMRETHIAATNVHFDELIAANRTAAETAYAEAVKPKGRAKAVEVNAEEKEAAIVALIAPLRDSDMAAAKAHVSAVFMMKVFSGWDLDAPFTEAALAEMCDTYSGALEAVFQAYNETLAGLRLGNSGK
ncbi:MAG: hypothetical protein JWP29_1084 [Rhodoferax sp.]|nr:hypothetical protein [Rhodoferax sp.]